MRVSSVRSCSGLCSERYICRNRIKTCLEYSAARILICFKRFCIRIRRFSCKLVNLGNIVAEFIDRKNHIPDLRIFNVSCTRHTAAYRLINLRYFFFCYGLTFCSKFGSNLFGNLSYCLCICTVLAKVMLEGFLELGKRELFLFVHKFFDCVQRVGDISNSKALRTCKVIYCSALFGSFASADTVVNHGRKVRQRASFGVCDIYCIIGVYKQAYHIVHLLLISVKELVKRIKFRYFAGTYAYLFAVIHTV